MAPGLELIRKLIGIGLVVDHQAFKVAVPDADALCAAVQAAGAGEMVSQAQCQTLVASADVSDVSDLSAETALEAMHAGGGFILDTGAGIGRRKPPNKQGPHCCEP